MKKNQYIAPAIEVSAIVIEGHLMQASAKTSGASAEKDANGNYNNDVKSNASYNVWDDDWSR